MKDRGSNNSHFYPFIEYNTSFLSYAFFRCNLRTFYKLSVIRNTSAPVSPTALSLQFSYCQNTRIRPVPWVFFSPWPLLICDLPPVLFLDQILPDDDPVLLMLPKPTPCFMQPRNLKVVGQPLLSLFYSFSSVLIDKGQCLAMWLIPSHL